MSLIRIHSYYSAAGVLTFLIPIIHHVRDDGVIQNTRAICLSVIGALCQVSCSFLVIHYHHFLSVTCIATIFHPMRKLKLSNSWEWLEFLLHSVAPNCHFIFPGIQYGGRKYFPRTAFLLDKMLYYSLYWSCLSMLQTLHSFLCLFTLFDSVYQAFHISFNVEARYCHSTCPFIIFWWDFRRNCKGCCAAFFVFEDRR